MLNVKKIILSLLLLGSVANAEFFADLKEWALEAVPERNEEHDKKDHTTEPEVADPNPEDVINDDKPPVPEIHEDGYSAESSIIKNIEPIEILTGALIETKSTPKPNVQKIQRGPSVVEVDVSDKLPIEFVNTYGYKVAKAHPDSYIINEDSQITFNPILNDVFYKADEYRIISIGHVKNATIRIKGNEITVLPNKDFYGDIGFNYVIASKDNKTLTSEISIKVMAVNDRPIAKDDLVLTQEDIQMILPSLTANDTDADGDNLEVINISKPIHGSIEEDSGVWVYTPEEDFYGIEKISYTIRDEKGAIDKGIVTIMVKGINDAPMAVDDEYTTNEDTKIRITDFLSNDLDVDEDLIYLTGHTNPSYGTITYNGKSLIYTPEKDFNGKDYFYYTIADTKRNNSKARITIKVTPQNDEPITKSDGPFKTEVSKPIYITSAMENDSDVDGDELSISTYTRPLNGEVSFDAGNTFVYIPNPGFIGIDRFTYTVTDGKNTSDVSTIEIWVEEKSHPADLKEIIETKESAEDGDDEDWDDEDGDSVDDVLNAIKHF